MLISEVATRTQEPELPLEPRLVEFRVQWATQPWMHEQALALRREVFCEEQGLFDGDDRDEIDRCNPSARSLVALPSMDSRGREVLGTVRIHEAAPGVWWGSRLAVRRDWRKHARLGTGLIRLAVSSAHALGCKEFLAHVQSQNVPLFERLHWNVIEKAVLHGRDHALMRVDLAHYPPCHEPHVGFVLTQGGRP